jgi:uncharacterized protein
VGLRARHVASGLAFDRASVRSMDVDGRLHVAVANLSMAAVNPYRGSEIPNWQALGLAPDRIYQMLRPPEELARAAPTFNRLPLLSRHAAVSANAHQPNIVIGATGSDSKFVAPYLQNSLVLWSQDAIDDVESEIKKDLSSSYRYRADMTRGEYEGVCHDGIMKDLVGNHCALVREGRAGPTCVVGDSALYLQNFDARFPEAARIRAW